MIFVVVVLIMFFSFVILYTSYVFGYLDLVRSQSLGQLLDLAVKTLAKISTSCIGVPAFQFWLCSCFLLHAKVCLAVSSDASADWISASYKELCGSWLCAMPFLAIVGSGK